MLRTMRNYTKVIMIIVILFFVASCFAGYGLYSRGNRGGGDGMRDYPVAEVNGRKVLRSELERARRRSPSSTAATSARRTSPRSEGPLLTALSFRASCRRRSPTER